MKKGDITKFIKVIQNGIVKHSPEILMGMGVAGMGTSIILSIKATPKALKAVDERKEELQKEDLTVLETIEAGYKPYIPAALAFVTSTACLIGAQSINARRSAALVTAYQLSTTALNEYKEAAAEVVGEEKAKEIREKIVEEKKEHMANNPSTYVISSDDDILMYESISNQEFKSTTNKVEKAMIEMNRRLTSGCEHCVSLNEFLGELKLKRSAIGDDIGWTACNLIDLTFDVEMNDAGKPRLVIAYLTPPEHGYREYY